MWGQMCCAWYTRGGNGSLSGQAVKAAAADGQVPPTSTPAERDSGPAVEQKGRGRPVHYYAFTEHLLCTLLQGVLWEKAKIQSPPQRTTTFSSSSRSNNNTFNMDPLCASKGPRGLTMLTHTLL